MAHVSEPDFVVLHAVRLKGFAEADAVASTCGLAGDEVSAHLQRFANDGLAMRREGRLCGWSLTQDGRAHHATRAAEEVAACGGRDRIEAAYRTFLEINTLLLEVCTAWQLKPDGGGQVPNDHSDPTYDKEVITRLREIDEQVQPVCAELARVLDRFAPYGARLTAALERVEAGDIEWFTKPLIDSYHTVWFELHEDLLTTLGIERSKEGSA